MVKQLKISTKNETLKMPVSEAREILERLAERIYVDRFQPELSTLLNKSVGYGKVGINLENFYSLKPRPGRLFAAFSGPCVVKEGYDFEKQKESISEFNKELGDIIDGNIHGATMWGFIKNVHESSIGTRKLSIGIMPWKGLWNLKSVIDDLPGNFPKMHYLAIAGLDYGDHATTFAKNADFCILLGGRQGAYLEAKEISRRGKFVVCHDLEGDSEAIKRFEEGKIVLPEMKHIISFAKQNLYPDQRQFNGETMEFEAFDRYLMENKIINIGFVSTSGALTNYPYFASTLSAFLDSGIPPEIAESVEFTSGGTRFGGVWSMYDCLSTYNVKRNGIMCGKGLDLPWANVNRMIYVGDDWGDESDRFIYTSDILVALSGGPQAKEEMKKAAEDGGRYPWQNGITVIALYDDLSGGATNEIFKEGYKHPNLHFFHTSKIQEAGEFLKTKIRENYQNKK